MRKLKQSGGGLRTAPYVAGKGGSKKWKPCSLSWTHCIHLLEDLTQWQGLDLLLEGTATVVLPSPRRMGVVSWEYAQQADLWNAFNLTSAAPIITAFLKKLLLLLLFFILYGFVLFLGGQRRQKEWPPQRTKCRVMED